MEPEKTYDIQEIDVVHLPKRHSEGYWYDSNDSTIRNYITGKDNPAFSGIGLRGLERAKNEYMSLGNTFRRKSLSAPEMAKYENKYHIDQSLFDIARDEIESEHNTDTEKYQSGKMSERRWNRKSQRYEQQMRNLDENQYILDQQQHPLKYVRPHQRGDIAPLLFTLGLPAAIIGGINTAPYIWQFLNHPITQTVGTIDGIRNLFTGNGVSKTYNHFKNREYGKGTLSLVGDVLDASPLIGGAKAAYNAGKALYNGDKISNVAKNLVQKSDIGKILFTPEQYFNETKMNVVDYLLDSDGKWLDKPVFGMNFVMNRRLPKKELDRIWHNVHNYNEIQKTKYGYYNNFIPFRTGIVRVPTWREQLNNIISNTPSNVGPVRAGAINKNGEITLFAESLFKPNIKGTMAHEYRHDVQRGFSGLNLTADIHSPKYSQLRIPTTIRPSSQFEAIFKLNENPNLKHAQKLLENTNKTDDWFKELTEFDAELANLREKYKVNLPWTELPNNVLNKMIKWLSNRFGISPEDVNSIATDLANNAYKNGGKLCKKQ